MSETPPRPCTVFEGMDLLASGPLAAVALAVKAALERGTARPLLTFDDSTGRVVDLDLRGSADEILARIAAAEAATAEEAAGPEENTAQPPRGRGRPRLGVVAREVTLLPRHWDWLAAQPGGASVALRRLVDEARKGDGGKQRRRAEQERGYRFMAAMAGDLPGFEEVSRALFADDRERFRDLVAAWPAAVGAYALKLSFGEEGSPAP